MFETTVVDAANNKIDIEGLCSEFGKVAERVQVEAGGRLDLLSEADWADVDRAERVVDECAEDLRFGRGDRTMWLLALESYERSWVRVLDRKAGRHSLAA